MLETAGATGERDPGDAKRPFFAPRAARRGLIFCAASLVCACRSTGGGDGEKRAIEIVVPMEISTLDPRFATRSLDIKVTRLVHSGLVGLHPETLEPVPLLSESWRWDGEKTLRVKLKANLRFHSGAKLQSRDVCETIAAIAEPKLQSPHRAVVRAIGRCEEIDATELAIFLHSPRATLLTDLEIPILRRDQAGVPARPGGELDGLGPYRIAAATPTAVELVPAETGLGRAPRYPVTVRTVRDENARALRLIAGKSDVAPNAFSAALLPAFEEEPNLLVKARPGANVTYMLIQNERAPLNDARFRRALSEAIDREAIVDNLFAGRARPASTLFPPGHWASSPIESQHSKNEGQRALLSSAPELTLLSGADRARVVVARAIAQMLQDAGARVRVVPLDFGVLLARLDAGDFEMAILQMPELTEPNLLKWFFHPAGVVGEGGEGKNRARYRSAEVGRMLDAASEVSSRDHRAPLYRAVAAKMAEDMPVIPLWHEDQVAVVSRRARSFELSAEGRWASVAALE